MTELEAQRIINEHRSDCPSFVRGSFWFQVRRDGRADVYRAVGKSGKRWVFRYTIAADDVLLIGHPDIRSRMS